MAKTIGPERSVAVALPGKRGDAEPAKKLAATQRQGIAKKAAETRWKRKRGIQWTLNSTYTWMPNSDTSHISLLAGPPGWRKVLGIYAMN